MHAKGFRSTGLDAQSNANLVTQATHIATKHSSAHSLSTSVWPIRIGKIGGITKNDWVGSTSKDCYNKTRPATIVSDCCSVGSGPDRCVTDAQYVMTNLPKESYFNFSYSSCSLEGIAVLIADGNWRRTG